jgi:sirohydrochlorin ferrochelatase
MTGVPALLAVSHGTSDPRGRRAVSELVAAVAGRLASPVLAAFVDVQQPDVAVTLREAGRDRRAVIVPLLLSAGYHVKVDLASAADAAPQDVVVTKALGPDRRLAELLALRLAEAGLRAGDRVVLAAAGSSDLDAVNDCARVGEQLAAVLGRPVAVGFLSAAQPRLAGVVDSVRREWPGRRVVVASYLLAPGYFAGLARDAGADVVSAPLLDGLRMPAEALVDVVCDLYAAASTPAIAL